MSELRLYVERSFWTSGDMLLGVPRRHDRLTAATLAGPGQGPRPDCGCSFKLRPSISSVTGQD